MCTLLHRSKFKIYRFQLKKFLSIFFAKIPIIRYFFQILSKYEEIPLIFIIFRQKFHRILSELGENSRLLPDVSVLLKFSKILNFFQKHFKNSVEVSEAKSLLEQMTLVCSSRPYYIQAIRYMQEYVRN